MTGVIRLPVQNAYNVRDLGGYVCDGGSTRWRTFIRADGLEQIDSADIQVLRDYGIRTVIDLRSHTELETAPDPEELKSFVQYVNIPLLSEVATDVTTITADRSETYLAETYLTILKQRGEVLQRIFVTIAEAQDGGILFHCAAGKDRTGVLAALLLGLVGVSYADILSNYEVTYTYIREDPKRLNRTSNIPPKLFFSRLESLEPSLEYLKTYGSVAQYLKTLSISDSALDAIIDRFVDTF